MRRWLLSRKSRGYLQSAIVRVERLEDRLLWSSVPGPSQPFASEQVPFTIGGMVADPVRNDAYVVDDTDHRVLAIDTELGRTVNWAAISAGASDVAVDAGGNHLYVAENQAKQIEIFALPDLTPLATFTLPFSPGSIASGVGDRLYVGGAANSSDQLSQIDANTGAVLSTFGDGFDYAPELRSSSDRKTVYVRNRGLSGAGGTLYAWDVSGAGAPVRVAQYPVPEANDEDFAVDEQTSRIYTMDGGVYGLHYTEMATGKQTYLPFPNNTPYGVAVGVYPTGQTPVYGGSMFGGVFEYRRSDLTITGSYPLGSSQNWESIAGHLVVTPNGHALYASQYWTGSPAGYRYRLNLIGAGALNVLDVAAARFTWTTKDNGGVLFDASASQGFNSTDKIVSWKWDMGDGAIVSATASTVGHQYATNGTFQVTLTVTTAAGKTGQVTHSVNVGNVTTGTVTGTVFYDENHNGIRDPGEPTIGNATVIVDLNGDGAWESPGEPAAFVLGDGGYRMMNIPPGTYRMLLLPPLGDFVASAPIEPAMVTVAAGQITVAPALGMTRPSDVAMNFEYLVTIAAHYGQNGTIAVGDLSQDGKINFDDLVVLAKNYGHTLRSAAAVLNSSFTVSSSRSHPSSRPRRPSAS